MPQRDEVNYFGAGPAPLATSVLQKASEALLNYQNLGLSIVEISHRSSQATALLEDAKTALKSLMEIPDTHDVIFMQAGASAQFSGVPLNLAAYWIEMRRREAVEGLGDSAPESEVIANVKEAFDKNFRMDYLVTGSWSLKASQEAALLFEPLGKQYVNVALDARKAGADGKKFGSIPAEGWSLSQTYGGKGLPAFIYYCDNETVDGVEFPGFPAQLQSLTEGRTYEQQTLSESIIVADMSSNILSRPVDVSKFGVLFFGAQKNISSAGLTVAIVRKDILTTIPPPSFLHALGIWSAPTVISWPVVYKNNSLYNTLELLPVYIASLVIQDLLAKHGEKKLRGQAEVVQRKADAVYSTLDKYSHIYKVVPSNEARSRMNICFRVVAPGGGDGVDIEKEFVKGGEERRLQGIKGHRSVGGIRISNYNAVTEAQIELMVQWLEEFAGKYPAS